MKAVILAAGMGKRMGELTTHLPKPLLEVDHRPFLLYLIENLIKSGYDDLGIVVGYQKEKIEHFLEKHNISATLIDQGEPKGTGHAVLCAKEFCGEDDFIVVNGDNYYPLEVFSTLQKNKGFNFILGRKHDHPERFGVLIEKEGFLEKIIEKPKEFVGNLVNIGLYSFTPEIFDAIENVGLSVRGENELTDAISFLAIHKKVKILHVEFDWFDLGTPEDIQKIEEYFKSFTV